MGKPKPLLKQLYSILFNPRADAAMRELQRSHNTEMVVYTMRGALLDYRSPFRSPRRLCLPSRQLRLFVDGCVRGSLLGLGHRTAARTTLDWLRGCGVGVKE